MKKKKYEKALFQLAFLEGSIEVNSKENMVVVPLIVGQIEYEGKAMTVFSTSNNITFQRTKRKSRGMPIFEPINISLTIK